MARARLPLSILALFAMGSMLGCGDDDTPPPASDSGTRDTGTGDSGTDGGTDPAAFDFRTDSPAAYMRFDRAGMPVIGAALVTMDAEYNAGDPAADSSLSFAPDILATLGGLHMALDDDIVAAGLTPCSMVAAAGLPPCAAQEFAPMRPVASLIVPDVLRVNPANPSGFPNGRLLTDPVVDVSLSVVLLDLTVHTPTTLVGVLNPTANDSAFSMEFPYLAAAHTM